MPDVFLGIQFGTLSGQRDEGDVGGEVQPAGEMPSGLIDEDRGVCAWRDLGGDLGQVKVHRLGVATRHDERGAFAFLRTDRAENEGRGRPLVARGAWARAALGPTAGDLVLLPGPATRRRTRVLSRWDRRPSRARSLPGAWRSLWNGPPLLPASWARQRFRRRNGNGYFGPWRRSGQERLQCRRPRRVRRSRLTAAGKGPNADRIGCETSALRGRNGSVLRGPSSRPRLARSWARRRADVSRVRPT